MVCPVKVRLILDDPRDGAWNMAVDEVLLESAAVNGPTLRIYQWSEPTLSLGYFQRYTEREKHPASSQCAVVRRSSGGGAILHHHELTYSFASPVQDRIRCDASDLYRAIHRCLVGALRNFEIDAKLRESATKIPAANEPFLCFLRQAEGDVLLNDRKVGGSAQRRKHNAVLQHGSVLFESSHSAPELLGIRELSSSSISLDELRAEWLAWISEFLGLDFSPASLSSDETNKVRKIAANKYQSPRWTLLK